MATMNEKEAFAAFDNNLKLDPDERNAARKLHNEITALLIEAGIIIGAFLQGSFARRTMLAPLRDVDKVLLLAPKLWGISPSKAMDLIETVLRRAYPDVTFERTRHSLKLDFGEESFSFDAVPAFETRTEDDDVLIANLDTGEWERSNTRELIRTVARRNDDTGGKFVHQVRMAKQAVRHLLEEELPGLHTESIAYAAIGEPLDHAGACCRVFEIGAELLAGDYTDPTGVDVISRRLKPGVAERARAAFADAARRGREARQLAQAGDAAAAQAIWREIFGEPFPAPAPQTPAGALGRAFTGGSVASVGVVASSMVGRQSARPTRSWRP